ncbi:MAG: hypothetical protein HC927_09475 [Deltaproteobacteria bacterium]|nr:hypothetical protein [Deltaproteobacteria bacterium]
MVLVITSSPTACELSASRAARPLPLALDTTAAVRVEQGGGAVLPVLDAAAPWYSTPWATSKNLL